ncbi:MAG: carboxypeptidase-like regulatory domain-containing protein, partial [Bacteroidales bacterium]
MKTKSSHKRLGNPLTIVFLFILLLSLAFASVTLAAIPDDQLMEDSLAYESYTGKILDSETKKPVVFANVILKGTSIGTVSNADGEFLIKVPAKSDIQVLEISHIGYETKLIKLPDLEGDNASIMLSSVTLPIEAVTVSYGDPVDLLLTAINNIPKNYSVDPVMLKAFYRETIKQNRNYVGVAEAVLDIYKAEYGNSIGSDRPLIYKGRKSQDYKKMDTIIVKLQGGPYVSLMLDIAKNPGEILSPDMMDQYVYTYGGITSVQDRQAMIIKFEPKEYVNIPLYRGSIFLDVENLAFIGMDFLLDEKKIGDAAALFIRKKPASMKVD